MPELWRQCLLAVFVNPAQAAHNLRLPLTSNCTLTLKAFAAFASAGDPQYQPDNLQKSLLLSASEVLLS